LAEAARDHVDVPVRPTARPPELTRMQRRIHQSAGDLGVTLADDAVGDLLCLRDQVERDADVLPLQFVDVVSGLLPERVRNACVEVFVTGAPRRWPRVDRVGRGEVLEQLTDRRAYDPLGRLRRLRQG